MLFRSFAYLRRKDMITKHSAAFFYALIAFYEDSLELLCADCSLSPLFVDVYQRLLRVQGDSPELDPLAFSGAAPRDQPHLSPAQRLARRFCRRTRLAPDDSLLLAALEQAYSDTLAPYQRMRRAVNLEPAAAAVRRACTDNVLELCIYMGTPLRLGFGHGAKENGGVWRELNRQRRKAYADAGITEPCRALPMLSRDQAPPPPPKRPSLDTHRPQPAAKRPKLEEADAHLEQRASFLRIVLPASPSPPRRRNILVDELPTFNPFE